MNLERSINSLSKRIERFDASNGDDGDGNGNYWKGKRIIPLNQWIELKRTPYAWRYFPDDFNHFWTSPSETELNIADKRTKISKWNSDSLELMECRKNPNYGRRKCFHCLLSPDWEEAAIFIGISRLAAKGLVLVGVGEEEENDDDEKPVSLPLSGLLKSINPMFLRYFVLVLLTLLFLPYIT